MRWIKVSEKLPLHKAHWSTNMFGQHDNDFPVRHADRYAMANIYDQRLIDEKEPKYMLYFEGKEHFENEFNDIEWLDESPSTPPLTEERDKDALISAYREYSILLCDEVNSLIGIAHLHGWRSERVELGKILRGKIALLESRPSPSLPETDQAKQWPTETHSIAECQNELPRGAIGLRNMVDRFIKSVMTNEAAYKKEIAHLRECQSRLSQTEAERDAIKEAFDQQAEELKKLRNGII